MVENLKWIILHLKGSKNLKNGIAAGKEKAPQKKHGEIK